MFAIGKKIIENCNFFVAENDQLVLRGLWNEHKHLYSSQTILYFLSEEIDRKHHCESESRHQRSWLGTACQVSF